MITVNQNEKINANGFCDINIEGKSKRLYRPSTKCPMENRIAPHQCLVTTLPEKLFLCNPHLLSLFSF